MTRTMLIIQVIIQLTAVCSYSQNEPIKYWDDLSSSQKTEMLEKCNSTLIKDFYEGKFRATDDDKTWNLLNELVAASDSCFSLSFYLLNQICYRSDGALSEMVGEFCVEFLAKFPKEVLAFFPKEREVLPFFLWNREPLWKRYALFVGVELYFKSYGTSDLKYDYESLKNILFSSVKDNKESEETLKSFWQAIDEAIKMMNEPISY